MAVRSQLVILWARAGHAWSQLQSYSCSAPADGTACAPCALASGKGSRWFWKESNQLLFRVRNLEIHHRFDGVIGSAGGGESNQLPALMKKVGVLLTSSFSPSAIESLMRFSVSGLLAQAATASGSPPNPSHNLQHLLDILLRDVGLMVIGGRDELDCCIVVLAAKTIQIFRASSPICAAAGIVLEDHFTFAPLPSTWQCWVGRLARRHSRSPNSTMVVVASLGPCSGPLAALSN